MQAVIILLKQNADPRSRNAPRTSPQIVESDLVTKNDRIRIISPNLTALSFIFGLIYTCGCDVLTEFLRRLLVAETTLMGNGYLYRVDRVHYVMWSGRENINRRVEYVSREKWRGIFISIIVDTIGYKKIGLDRYWRG
jgi:hypothetical protein